MRTIAASLLVLMLAGSALADPSASQPDQISYDTLLAQIKGGASMRQLGVMQGFAKQKTAPAALPDLLALLKQNNPHLDNNVSLAVALKPANWKGREEEIYRALIPLLTSQRSRVFNAAVSCLRKVSGEKMGPDADTWKAWFEKTFPGKTLDLSKAVYEWMAVVKLLPDQKGYTVEGETVPDSTALEEKLRKLAAEAKAKGLAFAGVVQVSNEMMNRIAQTNDFSPVREAMAVVMKVTGGCTVSPESDVFRAVYKAGISSAPTSQPAVGLDKLVGQKVTLTGTFGGPGNRITKFILAHGDRQTYCQMYNHNPHAVLGGVNLYLNPDTGQGNINCDPKLSGFNEIVIEADNAGAVIMLDPKRSAVVVRDCGDLDGLRKCVDAILSDLDKKEKQP